jgi:hypothetical protein
MCAVCMPEARLSVGFPLLINTVSARRALGLVDNATLVEIQRVSVQQSPSPLPNRSQRAQQMQS